MSECPHVLARYLAETNNVFTYVFSLSPVRTLTHHPAVVCSAAVMSRVVGTGWWDLGPRAHQLWSEAEESEPVTKQKASLASALLTARQGPAGADAGAVRLVHRRRSPQRHLRGGQRSRGAANRGQVGVSSIGHVFRCATFCYHPAVSLLAVVIK